MGCSPVLLVSVLAFAMFRIMDLDQIVQHYLDVYGNGIKLIERPLYCVGCGQKERILHRHGHFDRNFFTLTQHYMLPIFRFFCPLCEGTTNVIPDFVEKYHAVALDVKEEVVFRHENGESCEKIEATTDSIAGGSYSDTTLRRWIQRSKDRLQKVEPVLWEWLLHHHSHLKLPMGQAEPRKVWGSYLKIWHQVRIHLPGWREIRLFHGILRFSQPLALTVVGENPTKDVRRWAVEISRQWA